MKLGLGLKKETGFGFIKLEYSETDYDEISATTSNNTKVTADIDTDILALSVAKSFSLLIIENLKPPTFACSNSNCF